MPNWLLYFVIIASWGTSWIAIKYQLVGVHPQMSVAYRFLLSGFLLLSICRVMKRNFSFSGREHLWVFLQAVFLFSTNYILIYRSSVYVNSGLESIIFSTLIFMNIFNSWLFLGHKVTLDIVLATFLGFSGLLLIFNKELQGLADSQDILWGVALGLCSSYAASLGNILSARNQRANLPVLQTTALGMLYGGVWTFLLSLFMGIPVQFSTTASYLSSLVFLSIFASILAFLSYLTLLGRIGPSRAGYCVLAFPLLAVTLSIIFEDYRLGAADGAGMAFVLIGNYFVMFRPKAQEA